MNTGEEIRAFRARVQELREELRQTESSLRECEASCTHENTRDARIVLLPGGPSPIVIQTIECLDCGIHRVIPKPKKTQRKKV